jgi:hypothetical protein
VCDARRNALRRKRARPALRVGAVLAAVNDASRRLRRWPTALIERGCAQGRLGR